MELSFSSATPLKQRDWFDGGFYDEILDHSQKAVDLKRLKDIGVGLFNHDIDKVVGRLDDVRLDEAAGRCYCRMIFDSDEFSENIYQKVKNKTLKGISVGFRVYEWQHINDGETIDGIKGPAQVARKWEPLEVSVVSCPADPTVGIGRSIKKHKGSGRMNYKQKVRELLERANKDEISSGKLEAELRSILAAVEEDDMEEAARFIADVRTACGTDDEKKKAKSENSGTDDEEEKQEDSEDEEQKKTKSEDGDSPEEEQKKAKRRIETERRRASEITAVCAQFGMNPLESARFINDGTSITDVYRAVLERASKGNNGISIGQSSVSIGTDERDKYRAAVCDGLRMRIGSRIERPAPGADEFRHVSMLEIARDVLSRNGDNVRRLNPMDISARAFSTSDFPAIMSNLADVVLQAAYLEVPSTWRAWCRVGNTSDFKAQTRVRMGEMPELEPVLEGGEYKMADLVETKDTFSIGTFGKKFALTRQAIINDDLGAFARIPQLFGAASARTINRAVYSLLKKNPVIKEDEKPVFDAAHNNLGSAAALSIGALDAARTKMRRQKGLLKDKNAVTLNLTPSFLIIPPELETLANQILYSDTDLRYTNANVKNPFRNAFTPVVEAELREWEWYLIAAPTMIDTIEVAFLNGVESPTLEQQQGWNVDGIEYKVRLDFNAWLYEFRGMYKNPGAQPPEIQAK